MQFAFTPEQLEFRAVLRRYFADKWSTVAVRRVMETGAGWERPFWDDLNRDLGLAGVHLPEAYGGAGFGPVELGIVLEEMGRALVCAPLFGSSVLAAGAILNGADEAQKEALLPAIAAGETIAALAVAEPDGVWEPAAIAATATETGGVWRLDGVKSFVLDGHTADLLVVVARRPGSAGEEGLCLFTVDPQAQGVTRTPLTVLDPTRKLARIELNGAAGALLGEAGAAAGSLARTLQLAAAMLASEMAGGAEQLRESALAYTNMRMQFGRPLSSFQTMKHKQADMLVDVELAKSAAYQAAQAAAAGAADFPAIASLAKAAASEAYVQTALHTIQIHGGIGFTWDNDTHLWFKRARSSEAFLGDPAWHRERMLRAWGH